MSNYTHGGLPAEQARMWDKSSLQELGDILYMLLMGKPEERRKAVCRYWELKRHFIKEDFEDYIYVLDAYRKRNGHVPLETLITDATKEFSFGEEFTHIDLSAKNEPTPEFRTHSIILPLGVAPVKEEVVEQLSLF